MAIKNLGKVVGDSAYEVWLKQGNTGTEEDFIKSLSPVKGEDYFTPEEVEEIKNECKPQIVVGDITEASIKMEDNVNVQLSEPMTQLFLEFPEEIEVGYHSEITFTMSETEMTFYPDLEYDGEIAWYGQYVSDGRPYNSLGSTYHIVFTYDVNGMKAVINADEAFNEAELTKNKVTEITEENREDDYPNVGAVKKYLQESIVNAETPIVDFSGQAINFQDSRTLSDDYTKTAFQPILDKVLAAMEAGKVYSFGVKTSSIDTCIFSYHNNGSYGASNFSVNFIGNTVLKSNGGLAQARVPSIGMVYNSSNELLTVSFGSSVRLLSSDNNYSYTVSNDYTPAHKKYVDSTIAAKIAEIDIPEAKTIEEQGLSFMDLESLNLLGTSSSYTITKNSDMWNKLQELTFGTGLEEVAIITQIAHGHFAMSYGTHQGTSPDDAYQFNCDYIFEQQDSNSSLNNYKYYFYMHRGISYGGTNDSDISIKREAIGILTNRNTKQYSVSSNYIPAHKKYVDDAIAAIPVPEVKTLEEQGILVIEVPASFSFGNNETIYSDNPLYKKIIDFTRLDIPGKVIICKHGNNTYVMPEIIDNGAHLYTTVNGINLGKGNNYRRSLYCMKVGQYLNSVQGTSKADNTVYWDNEYGYSVTKDYHPAHKKYVDNAIAAQVGNISTILETLTTVSEVSE